MNQFAPWGHFPGFRAATIMFGRVFIFVSLISLLWIFVAGEQEVNRHFMMALVLFLFVWYIYGVLTFDKRHLNNRED